MWVATRPPPGTWPLPSTKRSSPTISTLTPLTRSIAAVASSRSDSLTRNSCRPRMMVVPSAKLAATASTRYSSIIEGARSGGTSTPRSLEARTRNCAIGSPASPRTSLSSMDAPISRSVVNRPVRSGLVMTSVNTTSEPSTISAATIGNDAEDGSAGTTTSAPCSSGCPVSAILRPWLPSLVETICAPKCFSISSVWSRLASCSITVVTPGAVSPASSTADLIWAEATGVRYRIGNGSRAPCSVSGRGAPSPGSPGFACFGALQFEGIQDPPHRTGAERGVAIKNRRNRAAGHRPHHQPASGAGIAEIERGGRLGEARDTDAADRPGKRAGTLDLGAQRLHRFGGIKDVFALKQARNPGFADRKRTQDEGPVGNRLVAGNADFTGQGAAGAGFQRGRGG